MLHLAFLGSPQIRLAGAPVAIERQKAVALLAYLAVSGQRQSREALAALLWPDQEPARAYANLRQALWSLNSALGPGWVVGDRLGVALAEGAAIELDVAAFRARLSGGLDDLAQAAELYRGDLLAGLDLRDSAPFEEWRFFLAEGLRRELADLLDRLAEGLADEGAWERAAEVARRRLALDPLHEPAHRRLMQIYVAAGQRAAALRQYDTCARLLHDELGAAPDAETTALREQILRSQKSEVRSQKSEPNPQPPATGPQPPATGPQSSRLPAPTTPFIGREAELVQIRGLLADAGCRLITLAGPGGIGKTRLAIAAAQAPGARFVDGVVFVALGPVGDSQLVLPAIAAALGVESLRLADPRTQLADYLRPRQMLLVADNLEQLVEGADQLLDLLEAAPGLCVLATSRERLGLPGEWVVEVDGLPIPEVGVDEQSPALRLFVQGARRAMPDLAFDAADLAAAAQICRLVGGTPLAIELAAAWVRLMPCPAIAAAIAADLDFLGSGARGLPERHRGLRAVFEHSWRLLSAGEQAAFPHLAIFRGGFTLEAAAAVAQASPLLLAALADKSLVRRSGAGRYDLHGLLRQYAAERLAADPADEAQARARHAGFYLRLLGASAAALKGAGQRAALVQLRAEIANIRSAWRHAIDHHDWAALAAGRECLFLYYEIQSLFDEGEDAFGRAAAAVASACGDAVTAADEILLGNLLAGQGWFALRSYRFETARALLSWALDLIERNGPRPETAFAALLANFQAATGGRPLAPERLGAQIDLLRSTGDRWGLAFALTVLGYIAPDAATAEGYFSQSLNLSRTIGDQRGVAQSLDNLGNTALGVAQVSRSYAFFSEALAIFDELGYRWAAAFCRNKLGYVARLRGDYGESEQLHRESLAGSQAVGDRLGVAGAYDNLGLLAIDRGDLAESERLLNEGLAIRRHVGHTPSTSVSLENLGLLALARGEPAQALQLFLESKAIREDSSEGWLIVRIYAYLIRAQIALGDLAAARAALATARLHMPSVSPIDRLFLLAEESALRAAEGDAHAPDLIAQVMAEAGEIGPIRRRLEEALSNLE